MRVIIRDTTEDVAQFAANHIRRRIEAFKPTAERPLFVLGLPTGSTPLPVYRLLVEMHKTGGLSFSRVATVNMDEYVGLEREHEQSYARFMFDNFLKHVDVEPKNAHIPNGMAADLEAECKRYEDVIAGLGGVDLWMGGVGADGHSAFNEPGSSLSSLTRLKTLAKQTVIDNARFFGGDMGKVPKMALTVGVATIMAARELLFIVTGQKKALALHAVIEGPISTMCTASTLQQHRHAIVVCDEDATEELRVKTVRYFKGIEEVQEQI